MCCEKHTKYFLMAVKGSEFPIFITASNNVEIFSATNVESHLYCVAGLLYESQSQRQAAFLKKDALTRNLKTGIINVALNLPN